MQTISLNCMKANNAQFMFSFFILFAQTTPEPLYELLVSHCVSEVSFANAFHRAEIIIDVLSYAKGLV